MGLFSRLSVQEAAARLKVHPQTIRRWIKRGLLVPSGDRGPHGALMIRLDQVEDRGMARGTIRPEYRPGDLVIWQDQLARVEGYRPSMGYLIYLGPGAYQWVAGHAIVRAK